MSGARDTWQASPGEQRHDPDLAFHELGPSGHAQLVAQALRARRAEEKTSGVRVGIASVGAPAAHARPDMKGAGPAPAARRTSSASRALRGFVASAHWRPPGPACRAACPPRCARHGGAHQPLRPALVPPVQAVPRIPASPGLKGALGVHDSGRLCLQQGGRAGAPTAGTEEGSQKVLGMGEAERRRSRRHCSTRRHRQSARKPKQHSSTAAGHAVASTTADARAPTEFAVGSQRGGGWLGGRRKERGRKGARESSGEGARESSGGRGRTARGARLAGTRGRGCLARRTSCGISSPACAAHTARSARWRGEGG